MNQTGPLKIGTRGSKLALWQARHVQAQLHTHWPDLKTECVVIDVSSNWTTFGPVEKLKWTLWSPPRSFLQFQNLHTTEGIQNLLVGTCPDRAQEGGR